MNFLEDPFIQSLLNRLNQPGVMGIALVGSYARGENEQYSDVDVDIFVESQQPEAYALRYFDGRLVSLKSMHLQSEYDTLKRPEKAIWSVPGLRQMQILQDETGQLAVLQQAACNFDWSELQPAANEYAVEELMGCAEEAHKIVSGLIQENESKVLYATWGLFKGLSNAVAVQRGLLITSENLYFDIIQESLGRDHPWTRAFRLAFGMDHGDAILPAYRTRGKAALDLYKQTSLLFKDIITEPHREVIVNTLQLFEQA